MGLISSKIVTTVSVDFLRVNLLWSKMASIILDFVRVMVNDPFKFANQVEMTYCNLPS